MPTNDNIFFDSRSVGQHHVPGITNQLNRNDICVVFLRFLQRDRAMGKSVLFAHYHAMHISLSNRVLPGSRAQRCPRGMRCRRISFLLGTAAEKRQKVIQVLHLLHHRQSKCIPNEVGALMNLQITTTGPTSSGSSEKYPDLHTRLTCTLRILDLDYSISKTGVKPRVSANIGHRETAECKASRNGNLG